MDRAQKAKRDSKKKTKVAIETGKNSSLANAAAGRPLPQPIACGDRIFPAWLPRAKVMRSPPSFLKPSL